MTDKRENAQQPDGVILDVDGTLWDSTAIVARAWERAARDSGLADYTVSAEMLKGLFGKTMKAIADEMFPMLSDEERRCAMERCCAYEHAELEKDDCDICYPGVAFTVQKLSRKRKVCIVSNCQSGYIELFLRKTGLAPYIADFECFGNTELTKDKNIRLVVQRCGLQRPVYVGDTQGDCDAAAAAGVPFVHAAYGFGTIKGPAASIAHFGELEKWMEGGIYR